MRVCQAAAAAAAASAAAPRSQVPSPRCTCAKQKTIILQASTSSKGHGLNSQALRRNFEEQLTQAVHVQKLLKAEAADVERKLAVVERLGWVGDAGVVHKPEQTQRRGGLQRPPQYLERVETEADENAAHLKQELRAVVEGLRQQSSGLLRF